MAENNAAATENTATPAAPKAPSKMDKAKELFAALKVAETEGKIPEGSSRRKEFINRAQAEIELTKAGAITYYNNLQNKDKGGDLYKKPKAKATTAQVQGAESSTGPASEKTEEQAEGDADANAALTEQGADTPADTENAEQ